MAVELTEEARSGCARVIDVLKRRAEHPRWIPVENLHVTMKFLGSVQEERVDGLIDALRAVAARHGRATLTLGAPGAFPSVRTPRVLWVGIDDPDRHLAAIAADVDQALAPQGFEPEHRPFRAHVTIARIPEPAPVDLDGITVDPIEVPLEHLTLFQSHLGRGPARYEALARLPLG